MDFLLLCLMRLANLHHYHIRRTFFSIAKAFPSTGLAGGFLIKQKPRPSQPGQSSRETLYVPSIPVMPRTLHNLQHIAVAPIYYPVFAVYPAAPPSRQIPAQWLGLADAPEGVALDVAQQLVDPPDQPPVAALSQRLILRPGALMP